MPAGLEGSGIEGFAHRIPIPLAGFFGMARTELAQVAEKRPYPANLCPLSGGVEFAGFGEDLGQPIGELIETMSGRAVRQRAAEHLDSVLSEE